jgi:hypothetical protein
MQLKELVLALLNESDLLLSDEAVEQIVDQVQCVKDEMLFSPPLLQHAWSTCRPLNYPSQYDTAVGTRDASGYQWVKPSICIALQVRSDS